MNGLIDDLHYTASLRKLILDNPELPLLVIAGQDACDSWNNTSQVCTRVEAYKGEFFNGNVEFSNEAITDRDYFREEMEDYYYGNWDGTEAEFDKYIENKLIEYEDYWVQCIIVEVDN